MTVTERAGTSLTSMTRSLRDNRPLLANTAQLLGTTAITSTLGFGFWWLAARLVPVAIVGYGAAAISAMTLLATFGMLGLNTVLIGELARRPRGCGPLVAAALLTASAAGAALAAGFIAVVHLADPGLAPYLTGLGRCLLLIGGAAITAALLVLDEALIGLLLGGVQLWRNAVFAAAKLGLLWLAVLWLHDRFGTDILTAWITGTALSVIAVVVVLRAHGHRSLYRPDWRVLRRLSRSVIEHNWLNSVLQAPTLTLPIVATGLSAADGGAFYVAWTIVTAAMIVPTHLTTVLFAVGAADRPALRGKVILTLRIGMLAGLVGVPILILAAHPMLTLFGAAYADRATTALQLLALGYFGAVIKAHYVALRRIDGAVVRAATLVTITGATRIAAAVAGGVLGGLTGLSLALLAATTLETALTMPAVLRATHTPPVLAHAGGPR